MEKCIDIQPASIDDCSVLSELAIRSKAHWGYSSEFLDSCKEELAVTPDLLSAKGHHYFTAQADLQIVGFYAVILRRPSIYELEALFVEPAHIGNGIGKQLFEHATSQVTQLGGSLLEIQSDPNALDFYLGVGAKHVGNKPSLSIPGRQLPLLTFDLTAYTV